MLEIYRTLARMQYLEDAWIEEGPHDMTPWLPICHDLGIDNCIVYLYSILPYVKNHDISDLKFFRRGGFVDFRDEKTIESGRDPMQRNKDKKWHMRPWMTLLSSFGDQATAVIYDAKRNHIGIYEFVDCGNSDPNLSSEEDDENKWDEMHSRSAPFVLRDIALWYEDLTEIPGGSVGYPRWDNKVTKPLYIKHGWPHAFDSDAFLIDQAIAYTDINKTRHGQNLVIENERLKSLMGRDDVIIREARRTIADDPDDIDALWLARWTIWNLERVRVEMKRHAHAASADQPDPQLWQIERLKNDIQYERRNRLNGHWELRLWHESDDEFEKFWIDPVAARARRDYHAKYLDVYERAYKVFRAEVGGDSFFADRGIVEAGIGNASRAGPQRRVEEAEAIREWLVHVPEQAVSARERARAEMEWHEGGGKERPPWGEPEE